MNVEIGEQYRLKRGGSPCLHGFAAGDVVVVESLKSGGTYPLSVRKVDPENVYGYCHEDDLEDIDDVVLFAGAVEITGYPDDNPKAAAGSLKVPLQLVPPVLTIEVAKVMKHGADKYGAFNFRKSNIAATVYVGAILRHCLAIADGQDIDPESGESHWAHIAASCGIALDAQACGTFVDDRAENGNAAAYLEK